MPPERLAHTFEYERTPGDLLVETARFVALPGGKTQVTVHATYDFREDRDEMINAGMDWCARESMERLQEHLGRTA